MAQLEQLTSEYEMRLLASLAAAAAIAVLTGSAAGAASLASYSKSTVVGSGTQPTVVCSKRRHRHGSNSGFYGGFVGDGYGGPYSSGFYGGYGGYGYGSGFFDDGAAPPYAFYPDRRRSNRLYGWGRSRHYNGPWY